MAQLALWDLSSWAPAGILPMSQEIKTLLLTGNPSLRSTGALQTDIPAKKKEPETEHGWFVIRELVLNMVIPQVTSATWRVRATCHSSDSCFGVFLSKKNQQSLNKTGNQYSTNRACHLVILHKGNFLVLGDITPVLEILGSRGAVGWSQSTDLPQIANTISSMRTKLLKNRRCTVVLTFYILCKFKLVKAGGCQSSFAEPRTPAVLSVTGASGTVAGERSVRFPGLCSATQKPEINIWTLPPTEKWPSV